MEIGLLKYPNKSHRKTVTLPRNSVGLAEFMGVMAGDGEISNQWQARISMSVFVDEPYSNYLKLQINKLFNLDPRITVRKNENTILITCNSTSLVDYLVNKGMTRGNKIVGGINIPDWVTGNKPYEIAFVRGLVDTDGCLYIHKHKVNNKTYNNIGFCFANSAKGLLDSVYNILLKNDIKPTLNHSNTHIYLYKVESVVKYLSIFGSSNPRIFQKYEKWRDHIEA